MAEDIETYKRKFELFLAKNHDEDQPGVNKRLNDGRSVPKKIQLKRFRQFTRDRKLNEASLSGKKAAAMVMAATGAATIGAMGGAKLSDHITKIRNDRAQKIERAINDPTIQRHDDSKSPRGFVNTLYDKMHRAPDAVGRTFRPKKGSPTINTPTYDPPDVTSKIHGLDKPFPKTSGRFGIANKSSAEIDMNNRAKKIDQLMNQWKPEVKPVPRDKLEKKLD